MRQVTSLLGPILFSNSYFFNLSDRRQSTKLQSNLLDLFWNLGVVVLISSVRDQKEYLYCSSSLNEHLLWSVSFHISGLYKHCGCLLSKGGPCINFAMLLIFAGYCECCISVPANWLSNCGFSTSFNHQWL